MAGIGDIPENYRLFNDQNTKTISIIVEIPGLDLLSNRPIYTRLRYGDPGLVYGGTGLVYGGLRRVEGVRDLLQFDGSNITLSQKLEPEQGRGSVSTMTLAFVDKDQYMSQAISPGVIIDEILGKEVKVWLGYEEISFPDDFSVIFRGKVTSVQSMSGRVTLQLSDPNVARRQSCFYMAKTRLSSGITNSATSVPVVNTGEFHQQILGPSGSYDTAVQTWIKIDDEYMQYGPSGIPNSTHFTVTRSSTDPFGYPQTPTTHDADTEVAACIVLQDNPLTLALKIMLSGWNGPYRTGVPIGDFAYTADPVVGSPTNLVTLPQGKSWTRDYGASEGDTVVFTGSLIPGNNVTCTILSFQEVLDDPDRGAYMSVTFTPEIDSPAVCSIRSQFDTLPVECGVGMAGDDVDVEQHLFIRNTFLGAETMKFLLQDQETSKSFIENELYLPVAAYSLTRKGKMSVGLTTPPIADARMTILDSSNVIDPKSIAPMRATNARKFFNQIDWNYDVRADGTYESLNRFLDSDSLNIIGLSSVLPIKSRGSRTSLGFPGVVDRRSQFLLGRYSRGATVLQMKVNYGTGNVIEAGDTVLVKDEGDLQITNFSSGERNLGSQLFEVTNRTLDIKQGTCSLELVSGLQTNLQDKFATWGPSSYVGTGSTTTKIKIVDSFGALYPLDEKRKWEDYFGQRILVHNYDWTQSAETVLIGFEPGDSYAMTVFPALPFAPSAGFIVDPPAYPNSTDVTDQALWKLVHVFWDPSVTILSSTGPTNFTVSLLDAAKFQVGQPVYTHLPQYGTLFGSSVLSNEVTVVSVVGQVVTVSDTLGYTPSAGDIVELIGFPDAGPPYRWI